MQTGLTMENADTDILLAEQTEFSTAPATVEKSALPIARQILRLAAPLALTLTIALPAEAANLYRYINDKGYQEIGYSVPNHLVPNGYDVIDESGRLVRRVAAQLSEEEYAAKLERERKLEACEKAVARVNRRYETLEDIDDAEAQFEAQLEESLQNSYANLEVSQTTLKSHQDNAASLERSGNLIPEEVLNNIDQAETTIANLTALIRQEEQSRHTKAAEFDEERRIFQMGGCDEEQLAHASW